MNFARETISKFIFPEIQFNDFEFEFSCCNIVRKNRNVIPKVAIAATTSMTDQIEKLKNEPADRGPDGDALRRQYRVKSNAFADLVTQCLQLDPKTRITPDKILAHPFCQPLK